MASAVVVGLMSGTSLDGISAAVARFRDASDGRIDVDLLAFTSRAYTREERARLATALSGTTPAEYCRLNFDLGYWLADAAIAVMAEAGIARDDISAIASHGQTIWHEPGHSTWQTGEAAVIAERTGIDVVSDFRVRDVAAGGQGAPLVPIADAMLFSSPTEWRGLQNLGGIGNITVVPPRGQVEGVRAFDTGPGASVIDRVTRTLRPDLPYDVDGKLALAGRPNMQIVSELLAAPYFAAAAAKIHGPRALQYGIRGDADQARAVGGSKRRRHHRHRGPIDGRKRRRCIQEVYPGAGPGSAGIGRRREKPRAVRGNRKIRGSNPGSAFR